MRIVKTISDFTEYVQEVVRRFPVTMLFCLTNVITWITLIAGDYDAESFFPVIISSGIGLIASLALHLIFENREIKTSVKVLFWAILIILIAFYYFALSRVFQVDDVSYCVLFRMLGFITLCTLAVSLGPFWNKKNNRSYLLFNRHLFSHYLLSAAYTFVLLIGLVLAILAIDRLFGIAVNEDVYGYLCVVLIGIFFTVVFLASIPKPEEEIIEVASSILRVFARYILVPIVSVYALIIFAYAIKNIFAPGLDQDWTQELIWWFYVAGYFAFLINLAVDLPHTLNRFGPFGKGFLYTIIPITILVLISIGTSMYQDGITELKYIVAAMSLYLLLIAIYLLFNPQKDFRWISGLLMIFAGIACIGPFNACKVSIHNQKKHLVSYLEQNNLISAEGNINETKVEELVNNRAQERIRFLSKRLETDTILVKGVPVSLEKLENVYYKGENYENNAIYFPYREISEISTQKYVAYIPFVDYGKTMEGRYLKLKTQQDLLMLYDQDKEVSSVSLRPYLEILAEKGNPYPGRLISLQFEDQKVDFYINEISYQYKNDRLIIDYIRGFGFLK